MNYEAKLSDIIASLADIEGGFLYSPEKKLYADMSNDITDPESLARIGEKFTRINNLLVPHYNDISRLRVTFKDLVLCGAPLPEDHWLFLFYRPGLSPTMLNMTVQLALNVEDDEPEVISTSTETPIQEETAEPPEEEDSVQDLLESLLKPSSRLSRPLLEIKELLPEFIGPVADLVFEESIRKWAEIEPPTRENMLTFNDIILLELDGENDRERITEITKTFLKEA